MRLWVTFLVCILGIASASLQDALDEAKIETLREVDLILASSPSLNEIVGDIDGFHLEWVDAEIKTELGKLLKNTLDEIVAAVKDALAHGKKISVEWIDRIKALKETLKGFGKEAEDKLKNLLEELKAQRSEEELVEMIASSREKRKFSAVDAILAIIKKQIAWNMAPEFIQKFILKMKSVLGELGRILLETLREGGHKALDRLIDNLQDKLPPNKDDDELDVQEFQADLHYGIVSDIFNNIKEKIKEQLTSEEIQNYIKNMKGQLGEMARVLLEALRKGGHIALDELIDRLKEQLPSYVMQRNMMLLQATVHHRSMVTDVFSNIKDLIRKQLASETIQTYIVKMKPILGKVASQLLETIRKGGHVALDELINRLIEKLPPKPEEAEAVPYDQWLRNVKKWLQDLIQSVTDRVDYIRVAAKKFLETAKDEETIKKGFQFFKHYRVVLGDLWYQILEKYQEVLRKPHRD